ncbi:MAG: PPC domain-containing DNA-binding protein [Candidatus Scalinduaceae bacterium]
MYAEIKGGRRFIGRFQLGEDLLSAIKAFCKRHNIRMGVFWIIGAVKNAALGYYNQDVKKYARCLRLDKKMEIVSCSGNISIKDNEIFVHAHITLTDYDGKAFGGHLMHGTGIFAAEFYIEELFGKDLVRRNDPQTGLGLWM